MGHAIGMAFSCARLRFFSYCRRDFHRYSSWYTQSAFCSEQKDLTLKEALGLALQRNPELAAFDKEIRALEGATLQAGSLRNPEISVNLDNAGNMGTGGVPVRASVQPSNKTSSSRI